MQIRLDDLAGPEIAALLEQHLRSMRRHSPPGRVHALDLDRLRRPEIAFWTAWEGGALLGCGALKSLGDDEGEIKSMHTATAHQGRGVGAAMLGHVLDEAERRSYRRLFLETGSSPPFAPARRLYERAGFAYCGPFADYLPDDFSVFMTKAL